MCYYCASYNLRQLTHLYVEPSICLVRKLAQFPESSHELELSKLTAVPMSESPCTVRHLEIRSRDFSNLSLTIFSFISFDISTSSYGMSDVTLQGTSSCRIFQYWFRLILADLVTFLGNIGFIGCNRNIRILLCVNNLHITKAEVIIRHSTSFNLIWNIMKSYSPPNGHCLCGSLCLVSDNYCRSFTERSTGWKTEGPEFESR
jgi:hypothetical protein